MYVTKNIDADKVKSYAGFYITEKEAKIILATPQIDDYWD